MPLYKHVTFVLCRGSLFQQLLNDFANFAFSTNYQIETFVYKIISPSVACCANQNKRTAELPFPLFTYERSYY